MGKYEDRLQEMQAARVPESDLRATRGYSVNPWRGITEDNSNGLPLWAQTPKEALGKRTSRENDELIARAIQDRYQTKSVKQIASQLADEMLPGYTLHFQAAPGGLVSGSGAGLYGYNNLGTNQIRINTQKDPVSQVAPIPHEMAHVADFHQNMYLDPSGRNSNVDDVSPSHHQFFTNFEPQMAQSMDAEHAIENRWPVNPAIFQAYPWLSRVNPLSSNKLASPWNFSAPPLRMPEENLSFGEVNPAYR